jgi:nicotinamide-nucleotide amidase
VKNIPESQLASLLNEWENNLHHKLKLAYLPKPGIVRLRLSSEGNDLQQLKKITDNELHKLSKLVVYEEILEDVFNKIHDFFTLNNYTLSVAESCSGGVIASKITANAGASSYFRGGVVAYSDDIKHKFLNIDKDLIKKYSSVSKQVAEVMSNNCCEIFNSDFSISTTGYAGPSLDNAQQPVGTVFISITSPTSTNVSKYQFSGDRELVISQVLDKSLDLIYKEIKKLK